ncbi:PvuII DNA methyltransferase [Dehalococcoides mccartyi]|uniref:DNA-methyltransferase n=1 Tax=Dehalococcoides mccartyi TaxID=61435 RepID=UPI0015E6A6A5|nr:site-specific DNA-methyltransferase [Dehalococcoides mccartyi]MBA2084698.1 PvuII DNA methyltransferase [Dehalococcoides mccartyi]
MSNIQYETHLGKYIVGDSIEILAGETGKELANKVQLILTSPPFPLNNKKRYGNKQGPDYREWFTHLAEVFAPLLTDTGSIVIELGNAWEPGRPIQSLLPLESLLGFVNNEQAGLRLCQQFICYNPSRLPTPAQWVTVNRMRAIDSYTNIWWMSKSDFPKADNRRVLRPYSASMKSLLKRRTYNSGKRPSEHQIGAESFLKNNGGSITHNVLEIEAIDPGREPRLPNIFSIANTSSNDFFSRTCRERKISLHPARMPLELACFYIEFLTEAGDLVFDPFAGSNVTGFAAELLQRKWMAIEIDEGYARQSSVRFEDPSIETSIKYPEGKQWK